MCLAACCTKTNHPGARAFVHCSPGEPLPGHEHFNPVPGPAFAEKQELGIQVNGSAAMTDRPLVRACDMPPAQ